jgi:hypothetical protein
MPCMTCMSILTSICIRCEKDKPIDEFPYFRDTRDALCRKCREFVDTHYEEIMNEWLRKHPGT